MAAVPFSLHLPFGFGIQVPLVLACVSESDLHLDVNLLPCSVALSVQFLQFFVNSFGFFTQATMTPASKTARLVPPHPTSVSASCLSWHFQYGAGQGEGHPALCIPEGEASRLSPSGMMVCPLSS